MLLQISNDIHHTGFTFSGFMLVTFAFMGISMLVGFILKSKFNKYLKIQASNGWTGREVAERMLAESGVHDVKVISVKGRLTDHYNPVDKTVNLSESVYNQSTAASQAVAAHECGHAIQHAKAYKWLGFRSKMVPIQNVSGTILNVIIIAAGVGGAALYSVFPMDLFLWVAIAASAGVALFALVTLPVEFDASRRALAWIGDRGDVTKAEYAQAKDALRWAAMTYVAAALAALAQLAYFIYVMMNRR